ncbi:conserved hypothetical protein [Thermotomaculum hydrothermale]|uniref:Uncharacterized protein n=1 Tax=Thermotomaculum hydrothermale TaxID=981385 RepID=A0A7R6PPC5_9BACT|nr:hypothetical protein [Thermotomaculum hydrothermale]BBB32826.1 conserved hypothetical protein [Thermotomaculum hydrothermale]
MKNDRLIPVEKEFLFVLVASISIIIGSLIGIGIIWGILDKPLPRNFHSIFHLIAIIKQRVLYMVFISLLLQTVICLSLILFLALRFSHKISGPMYRVKMMFKDFLNGKEIERIAFRKTDFLKPLESDLSVLLSRESKRRKLLCEIEEILSKSQKASLSDTEKEKLKILVNSLKEIEKNEL